MKQQESDETLESIRAWEEQEEKRYKFVAGLLVHIEEDILGWEVEKIALPQLRRAAVFHVAHSSDKDGRLGSKRTAATIR